MKEIQAYKNTQEAVIALDNGGRFFNLFTKAEDGVISAAELGKVAGVLADKQSMILFLELSISNLQPADKANIFSSLSEGLHDAYTKYKPEHYLPSEAKQKAQIAEGIILEGIPKHIDSKSDFNGFIMIPIMVGSVTTFSMVPIIDHYDVYEIRDNQTSDTFLIAHARSKTKLPEKTVKVAGVLKELKTKKDEAEASNRYLEAIYYMDVNI